MKKENVDLSKLIQGKWYYFNVNKENWLCKFHRKTKSSFITKESM